MNTQSFGSGNIILTYTYTDIHVGQKSNLQIQGLALLVRGRGGFNVGIQRGLETVHILGERKSNADVGT